MEFLTDLLTAGTELTPWSFWGLTAVSFVGSFVSAAGGIGGGVLMVASMAAVLPPIVLIPLHGIVQIGSNGGRVLLFYRETFFRIIPYFAIGTLAGTLVGVNTLIVLPIWVLQTVLGIFVLYSTWAPGFKAREPAPKTFAGVGLVTGFATMFVGGSGSLVAPFVHAACNVRQQVVATHALCMTLQHSFKIISFGFLGFAFGAYLPLLAALLAFGFLGTVVGRMVLNRLPERVFRAAFKTILTLLALRLLYSAAENLLA